MSEPVDRRARKKARTRAEIRRAAQRLFSEHGFDAVTIAEIAESADVAVQTVFNHFPSKEELFFDGYTPWVEGPADAVRTRAAGMRPLAALRAFTETLIADIAERSSTPERRRFVRVLTQSSALLGHELRLLDRAEFLLRAALAEAWAASPAVSAGPAEIRVAAALTAGLWVSATRTLLRELRDAHLEDGDAADVTALVRTLATRVFDALEEQAGRVPAHTPESAGRG